MKTFTLVILFAALACAGRFVPFFSLDGNKNESIVKVNTHPTIERVTEIGELCVLKIQVSDMLTAKSNTLKASWMIAGDALISIDLTQVRIMSTDENSETLTLQMPVLHVMSPRVNHEKTKCWDTESVCWHDGWFTHDKLGKCSQLHEMALKEAQKVVAEVSQSPDFMSEARDSAERIVSSLYAGTGYTVSFTWSDQQQHAESNSVDKNPPSI